MTDDETDDGSTDHPTILLRYDEDEETWLVDSVDGCRAAVDYWIARRPGHRVTVKVS